MFLREVLFNAPPEDSPLIDRNDKNGIRHQFLTNGNSSLVANFLGQPWQGDYVFSSGNLVLDMLHNFFLESGARMGKLRVYESTTNPVAKRLCGYLLTPGGVHQLACTVALEKLTGVSVPTMRPIPDISNTKIPETAEFHAKGLHATLYRFSDNDCQRLSEVFNGSHPEDGCPLSVVDGHPDGHPLADLATAPASGIPSFDMGEMKETVDRLMKGNDYSKLDDAMAAMNENRKPINGTNVKL